MAQTLRDTIRKITLKHINKKNALVFGQNLLDVGFVDGTLPKTKKNIVELPMADVADGGIVTGAALMKKSPIYIIRYQGYNWLNCIFIINYACKSHELWKRECKIFIRGIANEGCIGPVAGSAHISMLYKMPGIKIFSPMTSSEYESVYKKYNKDNCVYYISEHRKSFGNKNELKDHLEKKPDIILFLNSVTRFEAKDIKLKNKFFRISIINIYSIKPFILKKKIIDHLKKNKNTSVLICDNDYENGLLSNIAYNISKITRANIFCLGLKDKSAGHHQNHDNLPPNCNQILKKIKTILN